MEHSCLPHSSEQIETLQQFLIEFYEGIIPVDSGEVGFAKPLDQRFINEFIDDPLRLKEHNFHKNNLDHLKIDKGFPKAWRDDSGKIIFIQLRNIDKDKLLIGCGNNPTSICYHLPMDPEFDKECYSYSDGNEWWAKQIISQHKTDNHEHLEYITMDPNVTMNPTIIGFFGWYEIPEELIPQNSISDIDFEGISLDSLRYTQSEYYKLTGKHYK